MLRSWVLVLVACHSSTSATSDASRDVASPDAPSVLACPAGATQIADRTSCGAVVAPPASLLASTAQPGDVVSLDGLDEAGLPCMRTLVCQPAGAATMMFSDDPESPASDGVLYADTFGPGHARLYVYHVNADTVARRFTVVALNQSATDAHVTITKEAIGTPGTDYIGIGKAVAAAWLASDRADVTLVPAGTRVVVDANLDDITAETDELVHAILDVTVDAPVKLSIVSVLADEDAAAITASLPLLPFDGKHDRGTFAGADVQFAGAAGGEGPSARHVTLGDNVTEADLTGTDATTGAAATLHGNYGVAYRFAVAAGEPLEFAASARGGAWAGALGALAVVPLPTASGGLATTTDVVWLGEMTSFTLMSGGGSSLPLDVIVLAP
jgi:hypothetical protein